MSQSSPSKVRRLRHESAKPLRHLVIPRGPSGSADAGLRRGGGGCAWGGEWDVAGLAAAGGGEGGGLEAAGLEELDADVLEAARQVHPHEPAVENPGGGTSVELQGEGRG